MIQYDEGTDTLSLNLQGEKLGVAGLEVLLEEVANDDAAVSTVDISGNINAEEAEQPSKMERVLVLIRKTLKRYTALKKLVLVGNHLFDNAPHPANQHTTDYLLALTEMLMHSSVVEVDLSDNNIIGHSGRELSSFGIFVRNYLRKKCSGFTCKLSQLHSAAFQIVAEALGTTSNITYLDLSENCGRRDPFGDHNFEGIRTLSMKLCQSFQLKTLKLARNGLWDDDFVILFDAIAKMVNLQYVDVSGNHCGELGAEAVKNAIISHGLFIEPGKCLRDLNLSYNPLGAEGLAHIAAAVSTNETITKLNLSACSIHRDAMMGLQKALQDNCTVTALDISGNPIQPIFEEVALAEIEATRMLADIRANTLDCGELTHVVYEALARKLKFLSKTELAQLHHNPTFNETDSEMRESLHMLQPPERRALVAKVKLRDENLMSRVEYSEIRIKQMRATHIIHRRIMSWLRSLQARKRLAALYKLEREQEHEEQLLMENKGNKGNGKDSKPRKLLSSKALSSKSIDSSHK